MSQTGSLIDFKEKQHVYWHLKDGGIKVDFDRLNLPNREEFPYKYLGWTQFDALFAKLCILRQIQAGVICVTKIPPKREVVINPSWDETPYFNRDGIFEIDYLDTIQVDTNDMDPIPDYPVIDIKSKLGLALIQFHSDIIRGSLRKHSNFSQKCFQCHYCETEFDQDQLVQHLAVPAHKEQYQIKNEYRTYYKEIDQLLSEYREAFESQIKPLRRIIKEEPIIKSENTVRKKINLAQRFQEMRMVKIEDSVKLEDIQVKIKEG
ncbi:hypothetical protein FGO68_gene9150 [Halteria grandinella]|uniref:Uncharacterized protein n=1 Tax=Halteria grandinella TaxID=5974 RepID=A0A8J8T9B8_HALGN|nr:hypothetical protein FGO68_gene9150 [Halteria grandinella]